MLAMLQLVSGGFEPECVVSCKSTPGLDLTPPQTARIARRWRGAAFARPAMFQLTEFEFV